MRRRTFLTATSLSAAGLTAPADLDAQGMQGAGNKREIPRYAQDSWFDSLPGKHRLFLDATEIAEAAGALGFAWNFLRTSQTGYNLKDTDQAVIVCLRHNATELAFSNDVWQKYDILRSQKYKHPDTGKLVKGGNVLRLGSVTPKSLSDAFTIDGLARRGVHFAVCGVAARGLASQIAGPKATRDRIEDIMDELVAALPANAHLMASGILAAQRAGEYGYTVLKG